MHDTIVFAAFIVFVTLPCVLATRAGRKSVEDNA